MLSFFEQQEKGTMTISDIENSEHSYFVKKIISCLDGVGCGLKLKFWWRCGGLGVNILIDF